MSSARKTRPGDGVPAVRKSKTAEATGNESSSRLTVGAFYEGTIRKRQEDGRYQVNVGKPPVPISNVMLIAPPFGGLFGMQVRCKLPKNTRVAFVYGNPSFIYAVIPEHSKDWKNAKTRSLLWGDNMDGKMGLTDTSYVNYAEDLVDGEVEISNLFGVGIEMLTTLLRMKGSDRAAVECFLINDMVRILSHQFKHISGLGEELIFDHGRPTKERTWSMYRHEVLGALKEKDDYATMKGDEVDREELEAKRVIAQGRHRFREFVGFAGDFIHSFISDPPATAVSLAQGSADAGAGKSWFHRNSDGTVIIQSTSEIRLERVVRIPVAVREKSHEDQTVTAARAYDQLTKDFLQLPSMVSPTKPTDAYKMAYHIRSYARWLTRYHSFARMLQLSDEYSVPSEAASPTPDWNNGEEDREDENGAVTYYDAYACMTIMRDGSIVQQDGYGSSIVMSNGNVQISASRHLDFESAGDMRFISGGSIYLRARRNIELSAVIGGVIVHGYAWLKMICEKGTAWLRSNAETDKDADAPEAKVEGGPLPEVAGREQGTKDGFAVLIEATSGSSAYRSQKGISMAVDGAPQDDDDNTYDLTISSKGDAAFYGARVARIHSRGQIRLGSGKSITMTARSVLSNASEFLIGPNPDKPMMALRSTSVWFQRVEAKTIAGGTIFGPELGPITPIPDLQKDVQLKTHFNHISVLPGGVLEAPDGMSTEQEEIVKETALLSASAPTLPWLSSSDGPVFSFPGKEEYIWDDREEVAGCIPETLTQQYLRLDADTVGTDRWGDAGYEDWNLRNSIGGVRTARQGGFGNYELHYKANDDGASLYEPSPTLPEDMTLPESKWTPKLTFTLKTLKRSV